MEMTQKDIEHLIPALNGLPWSFAHINGMNVLSLDVSSRAPGKSVDIRLEPQDIKKTADEFRESHINIILWQLDRVAK